MKTADIKNLAQAYLDVLEGKKTMDPVNKDALKGTHAQRKDGDLDNDGDTDKSDEYLHKRRQAITKNVKEAEDKTTPCPKCDGSMENHDPDCEMMKKEGWDDMMKAVKDKQKEKGTGNFDKKKVSTGTVYQRKAKKDGTSKGVKEAVDWKVFRRIMEKQDAHTKGAAPAEPIDSKASQSEKDFVAKHGGLTGTDSGIDGAKAAADTAKSIAASVKVGPKRPGDETIGDKTTPTAK